MIDFEQAYRIVLESARVKGTEQVALGEALGRVLAADAVSDMDMPPHDMSAMDGFACRRADTGGLLEEIETIAAGYMPSKTVGCGQCSRIMTGAVVPEGADIVVMFEDTEIVEGRVRIVGKTDRKNIRCAAEDVRAGDVVLTAGEVLGPVEIAVLASVGCDPVNVYVRPRVGVVATGDELIEPREKTAGAKIRNSNSYQLCAQIRRAACEAKYFGIAADTPEAVDRMLDAALNECDVVLFSGGVSVGDYDFVPEILRKRGVELRFEKVKIKPGKPTVFGQMGAKYFFGLPGNPVSTFVLFEVLVRPFLMKFMGGEYQPVRIVGRLEREIVRRRMDRAEFVPVRLRADGLVELCAYHGSAHIHAYTSANGMIRIEPECERLGAGAEVEVSII